MDTKTINRMREHELAKESMVERDYPKALEILQRAAGNYGYNIQLTYDLANCFRKTKDFRNYFTTISVAGNTESTPGLLNNSNSQIVAQYLYGKNQMHNLDVANAFEKLAQLVWLPGIHADLRAQIAFDYTFLSTLFSLDADRTNIDLYSQRVKGCYPELDLVLALSHGNLEQIDPAENMDIIALERLVHAEKILLNTDNILNAYKPFILASDAQYLNALARKSQPEAGVLSGPASYSQLDYILREVYQSENSLALSRHISVQLPASSTKSLKLWRRLTSTQSTEILKLSVDLDMHAVRSSLGELDLNRKRIHLSFFNEFASDNIVSLEDLAFEVWNQRYDEKVYNRIRIFLQRINRELQPITGRERVFHLETPYVRLDEDVHILVLDSEFDQIA